MKGVFTTKLSPAYDDLPEVRYHFPTTYLNHVRQMVGDWIVYYEPRRTTVDPSSRGGRQAYFGTAKVRRIEADPQNDRLFYAYVDEYLEFDNSVPFLLAGIYFESGLRKTDGTTSKGAFGRAVRLISEEEYHAIVSYGFAALIGQARERRYEDEEILVAEDQQTFRPLTLTSRLFRDRAFSRTIGRAYDFTCAMTGLKLINGGGRPEIEAAHIRPIGDLHRGPDSIRNGLALSRTFHWLFDRGIVSLDDDYRIMLAEELIPDRLKRLLLPERKIKVPDDPMLRPHRHFIRYHREQIFRGRGHIP